MALLTRDEILRSNEDIVYKDIEAFGGTIRIKALTVAELESYQNSMRKRTKGGNEKIDLKGARSKLLQKCIIDEEGKRLFLLSDIKALESLYAKDVSFVYDEICEMAGLTEAEDEDGETDTEKN